MSGGGGQGDRPLDRQLAAGEVRGERQRPQLGPGAVRGGHGGRAVRSREGAAARCRESRCLRRAARRAFEAAKASAAMHKDKVVLDLNCRMGKAMRPAGPAILSKEYVTINADYHT